MRTKLRQDAVCLNKYIDLLKANNSKMDFTNVPSECDSTIVSVKGKAKHGATAGGPFKPGFGLGGAVLQPNTVFPPLFGLFESSMST